MLEQHSYLICVRAPRFYRVEEIVDMRLELVNQLDAVAARPSVPRGHLSLRFKLSGRNEDALKVVHF